MKPAGHHLAEFNFGTLAHDWDDPRIAEFVDNIDMVNAIAARSPGFVWRLGDDAMEAEQEDPDGPLADRPLTASTLSVWTGPDVLWQFVEKTLHARFMAKAAEWFVADDRGHFVAWWVPIGHRPTVAEGMANWNRLQSEGETDLMFGAARLRDLATAFSRQTIAGSSEIQR